MEQDKTLDILVRKEKRLQIINKCVLAAQLPIAILKHTPSGLENYLNSKYSFFLLGAGLIASITARITRYRKKDKSFVDTGVYGIVRNPNYLGFRLGSLGLMIYNPSIENLIAGAALLLTTELNARAEERTLEYMYSTEYPQYKEKVPRGVPYANHIRHFVARLKGRA